MSLIFAILMMAIVAIGFYCAHRLGPSRPLWIRLIVLAPPFSAMITLYAQLDAVRLGSHIYTVYVPDIARAVAMLIIYAALASRFSNRPWLDIHKKK